MNVISRKLLDMLSKDRWKLWKINKDMELVPFNFEIDEEDKLPVDLINPET